MGRDVTQEKQLEYVTEYFRSFIQSALEPILFNEIKGIDWQVIIGSFLQDQLQDLNQMDEMEAIQYLFSKKPSQRVKDLMRQDRPDDDEPEERRSGTDRRSSDGIDRRSSEEDMAKIYEDNKFLFEEEK
jgi:hypothetical protein